MKETVAVIAGSHYQFDGWTMDNPLPDNMEYKYIGKLEDCLSRKFIRLELVGTYWDKSNYRDLQQEIEARLIN